jgi:glycosyltransferase involved in cell wall biosynthesis
VITADTPAAREFFHDQRDVALVPPGDDAALAARILTLARDARMRGGLADAAGELARREFSAVPIARRFVALCEEAMAG